MAKHPKKKKKSSIKHQVLGVEHKIAHKLGSLPHGIQVTIEEKKEKKVQKQ